MSNRDEYLYDILREAGLNMDDPHDWVNIGILLSEPEVQDFMKYRD